MLLVRPTHLQLCKSPRRTSQSKFLSIHAPSCLQAGAKSGLEINASVNGFTPPLRFPTRDQTAPAAPPRPPPDKKNKQKTNPTALCLSKKFSYRCPRSAWQPFAMRESRSAPACILNTSPAMTRSGGGWSSSVGRNRGSSGGVTASRALIRRSHRVLGPPCLSRGGRAVHFCAPIDDI